MGNLHSKTLKMIAAAKNALKEHKPMTLRQVYYQLVAKLLIENNLGRYKALSKALVTARRDGTIPWEWIEDRLRQPRSPLMFEDLSDFANSAKRWYRRDVWATQQEYFEVWLEKDALSGFFEEALDEYGVTLNVGRGYDGWDSIHKAAIKRFKARGEVTILYFGDFDPSGKDMPRSLLKRITSFGVEARLVECALTKDDIVRYSLPPALPKKSDSRTKKFVAKNGNISVELDALPTDVLIARLTEEVEMRMDLDALEETKAEEEADRKRLVEVLSHFDD
jgi:hypothetical protein